MQRDVRPDFKPAPVPRALQHAELLRLRKVSAFFIGRRRGPAGVDAILRVRALGRNELAHLAV